MSFSSVIKEEMCRVEPVADCCKRAELAAAYYMGASGAEPPDILVTENAAFARRAYKLLRDLSNAPPEISAHKKTRLKKSVSYEIRANSRTDLAAALNLRNAKTGLQKLTRKKCCKKAALRGSFLSRGSVTDPEKYYHLEICCKQFERAQFLAGLMEHFALSPKIAARLDYWVVYIKDGGGVVDFLNITGAHNALMSMENTRILKDMRNTVNRAVNCETANIGKTADASLRQIANISYIKDTIGFDALPRNLREIAEIREDNREISLAELGQALSPPLGKSGVNHRLRKLDSIADDIKNGIYPASRDASPNV
jgi:DNA-binding protein WhiA